MGDVVGALHRDAPGWDVLVIDDGSTDDTAAVAAAAGARVVRHPFNLGIGGAVQSGFRYAREERLRPHGPGRRRRPARSRARSAACSRRRRPSRGSTWCAARASCPRTTATRRRSAAAPGIHLFAFLLSRIVGQRVSDPTSGFRLYNRRAIGLFARDYPHDYPEVEAVLMLHHHRLTMREVPVRMYERGGGQSSIRSGKSVYYMIKVLLAIGVGLVRRRPVPAPGRRGAASARGAGDLMDLHLRARRGRAAAAPAAARARARAPAAAARALRARLDGGHRRC